MINYLLLFAALALTVISGYISVVGLTSIFSLPSTYFVIIAIASSFELAKVLIVPWLHAHWDVCNKLLKFYLVAIVFILIFLNAISSFGFLSKSHIEQTIANSSGDADQIRVIDSKISVENQQIADIDTQIKQIDAALNKLTDTGKAATSLKAADQQRKTRSGLETQKELHVKNISEYNQQKINLESSVRKTEASVGPIKYFAQMVYGDSNDANLEKVIRFFTALIVFIFDPLAIILLIASNVGMTYKGKFKKAKKYEFLEIDASDLGLSE